MILIENVVLDTTIAVEGDMATVVFKGEGFTATFKMDTVELVNLGARIKAATDKPKPRKGVGS